MLKNFKKNASDIIEKHGFQIATGIYMAANGLLLAQNGINPEHADPFKNIIAPIVYIGANICGLANKPRSANTFGFFGTVASAVSFAGAGGHGAQWLPLAVATVAAVGQWFGSYLAPNKFFASKKKPEKPIEQEFKKNIWDFGFVKGSAIQTGVGLLVTAGAFIAGLKDMVPSAIGWNIGDAFKLTWATKNAKKELAQQYAPAA